MDTRKRRHRLRFHRHRRRIRDHIRSAAYAERTQRPGAGMNPDDDNYVEPEEDEEEEENLLECPHCGTTAWHREEMGTYTETHTLDTDRRWHDNTDNHEEDLDN